tara:strand:+ start:1155 stop:1346 length:192 start_codon:yes stop_codon:yes gene_type:complete
MKELKLNKQEKEDLVIAIGCFLGEMRKQLRLGYTDKEVTEKAIKEYVTLENKIEENLREYTGR